MNQDKKRNKVSNKGTKHILLLISLLCTTMGFAQTQYGYVKTRGRMDSTGNLIPGDGLKGAVISIKNHTSVIVKADDGEFSFPIPEKQFCVDSVRKKGYQLVDMDFCYKTRQYSSTPLDILMEIPGQSIEDYMEDFNRINASQQALINQLRAEVKQLKAQNKINEEEYSRRLAEIAEMQSESQKLVSEMAERYSKMDWDRLDDFNRQVGWLILNGELIKADLLIRSKGSMEKRSAELDQLHQANTEVRADLEKSEALEAKKLEDFAADCYKLFEICRLRHVNDSAAYWLELRASKDTTNLEWQRDVANFLIDMADYDKVMHYSQLGLRQAIAQFGAHSSWDATFYTNIGLAYSYQDDYSKALEHYNKALTSWKSILGENHPSLALCYYFIGDTYCCLEDFDKALKYYNKALDIQKNGLGENHPDVATTYQSIGYVYKRQGNYSKALEFNNKALVIQKSFLGENHPDVATTYENIGNVYTFQGDYDKALEYLNKALAIQKSVLGENQLYMATTYQSIGNVYESQGDYSKALEYYNKGLAIQESFLGKSHPFLALSYSMIGISYAGQSEYDKALEYINKALPIQKSVLGENHPDVIDLINVQNTIIKLEYEQALSQNTIQAYNETRCYTVTIVGGYTPAGQQGMSGEYVLLEFGDWNQDSPTSLFDKNAELRGKPKDILVMKDGQITQYHFENTIGAQLGVKNVGKEEKQSINKAYEEWKKQNRK